MKKAVILTGSKQYLVSEGDKIEIELLENDSKKITFEPLLIIDDSKTLVGSPVVAGASVAAEVNESNVQGEKVLSIRYKSKKRVHKIRGHRQRSAQITISKISV